MVELTPGERADSGHAIGHEVFFLDVYRLLTHTMASRSLAALEDGSSRRPLSSFVTANERAEISRLLVSIAAYYRVKYDDGSWEHGFWLHERFAGVGELVVDRDNPTRVAPLDFREACNKIIHATKVNFDSEVDAPTNATFMTGLIHLYGTKARKEWKAVLNIIEFCRAASNVIV